MKKSYDEIQTENKQLKNELASLEKKNAQLEKRLNDYVIIADTVKERVKELECMYHVARLIVKQKKSNNLFQEMVNVIPLGWQFSTKAGCEISILKEIWMSSNKFVSYF